MLHVHLLLDQGLQVNSFNSSLLNGGKRFSKNLETCLDSLRKSQHRSLNWMVIAKIDMIEIR